MVNWIDQSYSYTALCDYAYYRQRKFSWETSGLLAVVVVSLPTILYHVNNTIMSTTSPCQPPRSSSWEAEQLESVTARNARKRVSSRVNTLSGAKSWFFWYNVVPGVAEVGLCFLGFGVRSAKVVDKKRAGL